MFKVTVSTLGNAKEVYGPFESVSIIDGYLTGWIDKDNDVHETIGEFRVYDGGGCDSCGYTTSGFDWQKGKEFDELSYVSIDIEFLL